MRRPRRDRDQVFVRLLAARVAVLVVVTGEGAAVAAELDGLTGTACSRLVDAGPAAALVLEGAGSGAAVAGAGTGGDATRCFLLGGSRFMLMAQCKPRSALGRLGYFLRLSGTGWGLA